MSLKDGRKKAGPQDRVPPPPQEGSVEGSVHSKRPVEEPLHRTPKVLQNFGQAQLFKPCKSFSQREEGSQRGFQKGFSESSENPF